MPPSLRLGHVQGPALVMKGMPSHVAVPATSLRPGAQASKICKGACGERGGVACVCAPCVL